MEKVVLIGLGGIGSSVANKVYSLMNEDEKKYTVVSVLDTDIGTTGLDDIQGEGMVKIATSPSNNVDTVLTANPSFIDWFPDHDMLKDIDIRSGAGQIRSVSRLALNAAMDKEKLSDLEIKMKQLSKVNATESSSYRIIVVTSIVGGTGSGSFLQMGIYLRDFFRTFLPNQSVKIFGFFLLPDIVINTTSIEVNKYAALRTNTYAALKELNAMVSPNLLDKLTLQLQYKSNQQNINITKENKPFDAVLLFDYENSKSENMRTMDSYIDQMVNTAYYGFVTPMSDKFKGRMVNDISSSIEKDGEAFFSGSSVNKIIYPYEDIIDYFTNKFMQYDISKNWLKIDKVFEQELREYDEDSNYDKPLLGDVFINQINKLEDNIYDEPRFWKTIFYETREHQKKVISGVKPRLFANSIDKHIQETLNKSSDIKKHIAACSIEEFRQGLERKNAKQIIRGQETNRILFEHDMSNLSQVLANFVVSDIIESLCRDKKSDEKHSLGFWIANESEDRTMHPISIRYFLYYMKKYLTVKIKDVSKEINDGIDSIKSYDQKFNIESARDTAEEEYYESPQEVMEIIDQVSFAAKMFHSLQPSHELNKNNFINKYIDEYSTHIIIVKKHINKLIEEKVYIKLLKYIDVILKNWESLFSQLDIIIETTQDKLDIINKKHYEDDINSYIFRTKDQKENLWDKKAKNSITSEQGMSNISTELSKAQTQLFCNIIDPDVEVPNTVDYKSLVFGAYKTSTLNSTNQLLNVDIVNAIELESTINASKKSSLNDYIEIAVDKNWPWIQCKADSGSMKKFFGINENVKIDINNRDGEAVFDASFSKYEIVYAVLQHGIYISEFDKFSVSKSVGGIKKIGTYFKAYHERMKNLQSNPSRYISPHLDKRWNSTTHIPDINKEVEKQRIEDMNLAFLLGLINENLISMDMYGEKLFGYKNNSGFHTLQNGTKSIKEEEWIELYKALDVNPNVCSYILEKHTVDETEYKSIKDEPFIQNIINKKILSILIAMSEDAKDQETIDEINELFNTVYGIVDAYIKEKNGLIKESLSKKQVEESIQFIWDSCKEKEQYKDSINYYNWENNFFNKD